MIDKNKSKPLYIQIKESIQSQIYDGKLAKGNKIPTEVELMAIYKVSRVTVRKAINELVEDGLLSKQPGKGTFVNQIHLQKSIDRMSSWTEKNKNLGMNPTTVCKERKKILSGDMYKDLFDFNRHNISTILMIGRTRLLNQKPIIYERCYFNYDEYYFLKNEDLNQSLFKVLHRQKGIKKLISKQCTIRAVAPSATIREHLLLEENDWILYTKEAYYDEKNSFVYYSEQFINSKYYEIKLNDYELLITDQNLL